MHENAVRIAGTSSLALALGLAAACGGATSNPDLSGSSGSSGSSGASGATDDAGACTTEPCDAAGPSADAGAGFDTPTVCTSGTTWTRGNRGSASMHPGVACIDCHGSNRGPAFTIAGTVYPTGHEPDDCNGTGGAGTSVVITDKNGKVTTIAVNAAGNFYSTAAITKPFQAKVVKGGSERVMTGAQTVGDCNTCHTEKGASSAPGRIVTP
jgi:hypothetical protein